MNIIISILFSSAIIAFGAWVSKTNPRMAGFITALPLSSMLVLIISQMQTKSGLNTLTYARSIFYSLPLTSLFFIPFLIEDKTKIGFWPSYILGILLLAIGYYLTRNIFTGQD